MSKILKNSAIGLICLIVISFWIYNGLQNNNNKVITSSKKNNNPNQSDLFRAMFQISRTGSGPKEQTPSIGCSIKWRKE